MALGRGGLGTRATARLRCQAGWPRLPARWWRTPHQASCAGLRPETVGVEFKSRPPGRIIRKGSEVIGCL